MFTAIIENEGNTLVMEFPCKRYLMADHLGSIGIRKPAHEIKCMDEEEEPIKVKIVGNNEFEKRLALLISPTDTLSLVNTMCEFYQNLPYQNRLDAMEAVMSGKVSSIAEFDKFMLESRMEDTTEYFYCPLVANVYSRDEYGNMEDYPDEYDGSYLAPYEKRIRDLIRLEDARDEDNLAAYFDGNNGAVGKLKEVHFCTQNVDGVLYDAAVSTLIAYPEGRTETVLEIPAGVTAIAEEAFGYSSGLQTVIIPETVTEFPESNLFELYEQVSLTVAAGSAAEEYAVRYSIPYCTKES